MDGAFNIAEFDITKFYCNVLSLGVFCLCYVLAVVFYKLCLFLCRKDADYGFSV